MFRYDAFWRGYIGYHLHPIDPVELGDELMLEWIEILDHFIEGSLEGAGAGVRARLLLDELVHGIGFLEGKVRHLVVDSHRWIYSIILQLKIIKAGHHGLWSAVTVDVPDAGLRGR